jgi:hypothetical protein
VRRYVNLMWPPASLIRRTPRLGPSLNWRLLVAGYSNENVWTERLKEWAYLDTLTCSLLDMTSHVAATLDGVVAHRSVPRRRASPGRSRP